jgi:hypothetical protein
MTDLPSDPATLIAARVQLDTWLKTESKRMQDYFAPYRQRLQQMDEQLLALSLSQKWENFRTEHGTAYRQTTLTPKIEDRDKFLDFCLDNWDTMGDALLQLRAPAVEAVKEYLDSHEKSFPPGTTGVYDTHINIRRS